MKTENKTQQENEQKEKTATTADDDDNDNNVSEDDEDEKPIISSPVAHLWTGKDGCRPLVRPEDATSTGMLHVLKINKQSQNSLHGWFYLGSV